MHKKIKTSSHSFFHLLLASLMLLVIATGLIAKIHPVVADDDDDDDDDKRKTKTTTNVDVDVKYDVTKDVVTTYLQDSDGDGLIDRDDPHPSIAEIYIVKDENRNGIVDDFEEKEVENEESEEENNEEVNSEK